MAVELLPQALYWAPDSHNSENPASTGLAVRRVPIPGEAHVLRLKDYATDPYIRGGVYCVPHYRPEAAGKATGPLALDQVVAFAGLLKQLLAQHGCVAVVTEPDDNSRSANAAVLTGAYLMIMEGWTAKTVAHSMGGYSRLNFPCSWTRAMTRPALLTVADCWHGLQLALDRKWLDSTLLKEPTYRGLACHQYSQLLTQYDAAWLAPGEVMVGADPATVISDPDPATCSKMEPAKPAKIASPVKHRKDGSTASWPSSHTDSTMAASALSRERSLDSAIEAVEDHEGHDIGHFDVDDILASFSEISETDETHELQETADAKSPLSSNATPESESIQKCNSDLVVEVHNSELVMDDNDSVHTVCKEYRPNTTTLTSSQKSSEPLQDYMTWFKQNNIGMVIRGNFSDEPGLSNIGGSYDAAICQRHGLEHVDLPTVDRAGGIPDRGSLSAAVQAARGTAAGSRAHEVSSQRSKRNRRGRGTTTWLKDLFFGVTTTTTTTTTTKAKAAHIDDNCSSNQGTPVSNTISEVSTVGEPQSALFVHCKGGFGRSVVIACCILIAKHDIPGRALLGWIRLARPGAITTPQQESFLASLSGAEDLLEYLDDVKTVGCLF